MYHTKFCGVLRRCASWARHRRPVYKLPFCSLSTGNGSPGSLVKRASAIDGGNVVWIQWKDGAESEYHARWLFENCSSAFDNTGQKVSTASRSSTLKAYACKSDASESEKLTVEEVKIEDDGGTIEIRWPWDDSHALPNKSFFDSTKLKQHSYSEDVLKKHRKHCDPLQWALKSTDEVPKISYEEIMESDAGVFKWTDNLSKHGLCLVKNVPTIEETIQTVASRICPTIETLYGRTFDVRVEKKAINIAYTSTALEPHMDLAYYESPPGIQMLHCLEFSENIVGGESTFLDTFVLANEFKRLYPEAFETFCRVPATFQKSHVEREHPAQMFFQRPHISTNHDGDVNAVFWSPPFEGPLKVSTKDVEAYYDAYDKFKYDLVDNEEYQHKWKLQFRLEPGDMISFNQRRMLHGRNGWKDPVDGGARHLQGTYLNIDDFLNRHRYLNYVYGTGTLGVENSVLSSNSSFS